MPERNLRKSPSRAAAAAAAAAAATTAATEATTTNNAISGKSKSLSPKKKSPARASRRTERSPARRTEKSPARRTEKSPARRTERSPARTEKSPSRRTGRSPARRAEKSPSRTTQKSSPSRKKSPGRKPKSPTKQQYDLLSAQNEEIIKYQPQVIVPNHARGDGFLLSNMMRASREASTSSSVIIRKSTRVITNQELENKYEETKGIEQLKVAEDSDVEYPEKPEKLEESKQDMEFGGAFGGFFALLLLQISLFAAYIYSSKAQYGIKDFKIPLNWRAYLDLEVAALYLGFIVFQLILSILPIGKVADGLPGKLGRLQYRCNGFLSLIITLISFGALHYFKYPITIIVDKYIQFYVTAIIFGHIIGLILYIKGGRAPLVALNPYAVTGNRFYDFFMGREINPRIGPFDVKMGLLKAGMIGLIVMNGVIILKSWEQSGGYSPTLVIAAGLQIWYSLDTLWFEETFLATFEVMYEGMGLMLAVGYPLIPFVYSLITRFILNYRLESSWYSLVIIAVINTIGFVIYRGSNSQKYEFRKNPLNPALAHLETIPTSRGKKILVSGWWGWVRHPNYLGDIIMHWCFASTCGLAHPLPYAVALLNTLVLLHRAKRDDARCSQRYNTAWDRYCSRVKYHIIPKVF